MGIKLKYKINFILIEWWNWKKINLVKEKKSKNKAQNWYKK